MSRFAHSNSGGFGRAVGFVSTCVVVVVVVAGVVVVVAGVVVVAAVVMSDIFFNTSRSRGCTERADS